MFLHSGLRFDRFGEESSDVDDKILELKVEFSNGAKSVFDQIRKKYDEDVKKLGDRLTVIEKVGELYTVTNTYFSTKGRRIVSAKPGIDKTDVVIMEQLNEVNDKVKKLLKGIEVTDDCIKIKGQRRICGVTRAKNIYDVVTDIQRVELNNKLSELTQEINTALTKINNDIASLKNKQ